MWTVTKISDVRVLGVLLACSALRVQFVRKMNHPSVLYVLSLRTTYQMRGVAAVRVVAHQVPDNERHVNAVVVWDELGKLLLAC